MIIYASIGNSDDKLTQQRWSAFATRFVAEIRQWAHPIHGVWHSLPDSKWQNACVCFEIDPSEVDHLKQVLSRVGKQFGQDSIAWAVAETEFI